MNRSIGGYFELELSSREEYYKDAIRLNSARHCLELLIIQKKIKKLYLPYYSCDVLLEPCKRNNIEIVYYNINSKFEIIDEDFIKTNEYIVYTNYYGLKENYVRKLIKKYSNIIIDNAQAFYSKPHKDVDTFYSPRKFFGVPDGGILYTNVLIDYKLPIDKSYDRIDHLIQRIDTSAEEGFHLFKENDNKISDLPIRKMSKLTEKLLKNIDYKNVKKKRIRNFKYIHNRLKKINQLSYLIDNTKLSGPMVYPFQTDIIQLRETLISNNIYVAQYWLNVLDLVSENTLESKLVKSIIPLPIDQRYSRKEMDQMIEIIENHA